MTELDGIVALLVCLVAAVVWLGVEVQRLHATIEPLATSTAVRTLSAL